MNTYDVTIVTKTGDVKTIRIWCRDEKAARNAPPMELHQPNSDYVVTSVVLVGKGHQDVEQVVPLSSLNNLARWIAEAKLKYNGEYFCNLDGKRTQVVAG